jgi:adenylate cyclase class 2
MLEIELKVRVGSLAPVRQRLARLGATLSEKVTERDVYYNAPHRDFAATDEALRARYTDAGCIVTYKGPKRKKAAVKARDEFSCRVSPGEECEEILARLGFRRTAVVEKAREYYRLGRASVALDDVADLGTFIEIEYTGGGTAEEAEREISRIQEELGAKGDPILLSYLEMLLDKRENGTRP